MVYDCGVLKRMVFRMLWIVICGCRGLDSIRDVKGEVINCLTNKWSDNWLVYQLSFSARWMQSGREAGERNRMVHSRNQKAGRWPGGRSEPKGRGEGD